MHAPLHPAVRVEWRPLADLNSIVEPWRALAERALEPNVFYDPAFALAAAPVFGARCGAVLVWSAHGRLLGLFPGRVTAWRDGLFPTLAGWTHPYAPLGTPLVDRNEAETVIAAWLEHLAHDAAMPPLVLLPMLPETGRFAAALDVVLLRQGLRNAAFGHHQRAMLDPGTAGAHAVRRRKRKELNRQRRRLEDVEPVSFTTTNSPHEVAAAIQDFLVLEASGWKGVAQTAAVNDPAIRGFVETAITALAAESRARIDRMMFGARTIAIAITLRAGDTGWFWKTAYNEGVAKFSPGVQLVYAVTPQLAALPDLVRIDSCAVADHPMIDHMWHERLALSDRLIAVKPSVWPFGLVCRAEDLRRRIIDAAKALRERTRARRARPASSPGAQQPADDLASGGHRHLRDEGDLARILMRGQSGAHEVLDVGGKRV